MLKKRIIFTLLFDRGYFMLSRNFRLQRVGDALWLEKNYNFSDVAFYIDELVVLDVSRGERDPKAFVSALEQLSLVCFAPIAAGGGIDSSDYARNLLRSGADKVVLNSALWRNPELVECIAGEFGQQCVVASIDLKKDPTEQYQVLISNGQTTLDNTSVADLECKDSIGEIYLNSIDRDGTGQGFDFGILDVVPTDWRLPIIMAGGVGNAKHFAEGLDHDRVDAVATAHLFNFVGDGLKNARGQLTAGDINLASWPDK